MSSTNDDMVVAYGVLKQIRLQIYVECDLRAAEMVAVWGLDGLCFSNEIAVKVWAAPFE